MPVPTKTTRTFVALPLAKSQHEALEALTQTLKRTLPNLRWPPVSQAHLTLAFLGDVPPELAAPVQEAVRAAAATHAPFFLELGGAGVFPSPRRARVLWVGCRDGREAVIALQADIADALRAVGVELEERPFRPHVTIGRTRGRPRALTVPEALERWSGPPALRDAVHVMGSDLGPSGAVHTLLDAAPLEGPRPAP